MTDTIEFDKDTHKYYINNQEIPGVSAVISYFEISPKFYGVYAANKGTYIHELLRLADESNLGEYKEEFKWYINSWKDFKNKYEYLLKDGSIVDIKTGQFYNYYPIQLVAYKILAEENKMKYASEQFLISKTWMFGGTPDRIWAPKRTINHLVLVMMKDEKYEVKIFDPKPYESIFKSMMQIYNYKKRENIL